MGARETPARGAATLAVSPWILGAPGDLLLLIATPLLVLPAVHLARGRWASSDIYLVVAAFGALGHHLPGMMRAYGDRRLFERFKVRFILAPILLATGCVAFALVEKSVLVLVVYVWGAWHALMQTHGFMRIYDSRAGSTGRLTRVLDQAACLAGFGGALVFSDTRMHYLYDQFYRSGGGALPGELLTVVRMIAGPAILAVAALWLAWFLQGRWKGLAPSPIKALLLASSAGFFWYANVVVEDLLVAVVLFEVFHDVQYLSIVWIFNRRRVDSDPGVGAFTRFVFRPSTGLAALYVGLVFLYGSLYIVQEMLLAPPARDVMAGLLAASALLHFYYDGFIWKLREPETRRSLGIAPGAAPTGSRAQPVQAWAGHAARWALLVVPVGLLAVSLARGAMSEDARMLALAASLPGDAGAQRNRAVVLYRRGDLAGAVSANRVALALDPADAATMAKTRHDLAALLLESGRAALRDGRVAEATAMLSEAGSLDRTLADRVNGHGLELAATSVADAELEYRAATLLDPSHGRARFNLAVACASSGRWDEAGRHAAEARRLLGGDPRAEQLVRDIATARARATGGS